MNIAYSLYLQNALEHSTLTDEEKQGAHAFLKFLSNYKPKGYGLAAAYLKQGDGWVSTSTQDVRKLAERLGGDAYRRI